MRLYRVTFTTQLLVECESEGDAERIGRRHLTDEVGNGTSQVHRVEEVRALDELLRTEHGSLPWRDRNRHSEPETSVDDLLAVQSMAGPV